MVWTSPKNGVTCYRDKYASIIMPIVSRNAELTAEVALEELYSAPRKRSWNAYLLKLPTLWPGIGCRSRLVRARTLPPRVVVPLPLDVLPHTFRRPFNRLRVWSPLVSPILRLKLLLLKSPIPTDRTVVRLLWEVLSPMEVALGLTRLSVPVKVTPVSLCMI